MNLVLRNVLLVLIPVALALCLIIAFLLAKVEFAKLSSHYAMEDYRRDLTNRLAHDLKSPLTVISGCAENLQSGINTEKSVHYADSILENVRFMDDIIANVLELSKAESQTAISKSSFDASELVKEILKTFEPKISSRKLSVNINGTAPFTTDKEQMKSILSNLIGNAVKYTDEGGNIIINCNPSSVAVANTYSQVEKLDLSTLTEPFVKGDNSRSGRNGSGLGLSIAKATADNLGLELQLSAAENTFTAQISDTKRA